VQNAASLLTTAGPIADRVLAQKNTIPERIDAALTSSDTDTVLEGQVGNAFRDEATEFQERLLDENGVTRGEIDVGTPDVVIEVTSGVGKKKLKQLDRLSTQPEINGRPIVLYGPNLTNEQKKKAFEDTGYKVYNSLTDLATDLNK